MENKKIKVTNRNCHSVGYPVPDNTAGLERIFASGETKLIDFEELEKLAWAPGGMYLLKNYFVMDDEEAIELILGEVEPEYYYTAQDVKKLLVEGTVDELLDALDFGPGGVVELIRKIAVDIELPDMRKREAIQEKTGLNVTQAIYIRKEYADDVTPNEIKKTRRVNGGNAAPAATTGRRVTSSK